MNQNEILSLIDNHLAKQRRQFDVTKYLFDKQLEFVLDSSRLKTACCGGRAGKTIADAAYLIQEALRFPGCRAIYITLTRINAKHLVWPELLKINRLFNLGGKINEADLTIKYGDSIVWASGAETRGDIEKFRGHPIRLCIIDEVQSFPLHIKELIDDVITTRLYDYNGVLALTGTPGYVPGGYFFDACHNPRFKHFYWTMFENPFIGAKNGGRTAQELLNEELEKTNITIEEPRIQREIFGRWVLDTKRLILNYSKEINHFDELPLHKNWSHIMGIDLGFKDADAICVLAHCENSPTTYLVHEDLKVKQGLTDLFSYVEKLRNEYAPYKIVIDCGGLGLKIAEEMRRRWRIPVNAAEKTRKFENLELLNDALRVGTIKAKNNSRFAQEANMLEWDVDKSKPDRKVVSDKFHSDIIDAVLYGFRESPAYSYTKPIEKPKEGTPQWYKEETKRMEEEAWEKTKNTLVGSEMEFI